MRITKNFTLTCDELQKQFTYNKEENIFEFKPTFECEPEDTITLPLLIGDCLNALDFLMPAEYQLIDGSKLVTEVCTTKLDTLKLIPLGFIKDHFFIEAFQLANYSMVLGDDLSSNRTYPEVIQYTCSIKDLKALVSGCDDFAFNGYKPLTYQELTQ